MKNNIFRCTCDRCGTVIEEHPDATEKGVSSVLLNVEGTLIPTLNSKLGRGLAPLKFEDLCEKCEARVLSLLEQVVKTGKGRGKAKTKTVKKKNTTKPTSAAA